MYKYCIYDTYLIYTYTQMYTYRYIHTMCGTHALDWSQRALLQKRYISICIHIDIYITCAVWNRDINIWSRRKWAKSNVFSR